MPLLADRMVGLARVDALSHGDGAGDTRKNVIMPHLKEQWCIRSGEDREFVAAMEDLLVAYHGPRDRRR